jgi:pyruvate-formate lyase
MAQAVAKELKTGYLLDPGSVGVTLGTPGMPTQEGWETVTPEMWKFRWNVADKIMVSEPAYYQDKDWYIDATRPDLTAALYEKDPTISPADLAATALAKYLDSQRITIRPYDMLLGCHSSDRHAVLYDPLAQPWPLFVRAKELTGKVYVWENGNKVPMSEEKYRRLEKFAQENNMVPRVKKDFTEDEFRMYYYMEQPGRYFEPMGTTGFRANPDHGWYLRIGLREVINQKQKSMEQFEKELEKASGERTEELKDKIRNCQATIKVTEAVIRWIKRHAEEAGKAILQMPDAKARETLRQAAANCEWVAENPPRTFWEAMQLYWFCFQVIHCIETPCNTKSFLPDRTFWEWYERDVIKEKTISRVRAGEIVACYATKFHECIGTMARFGATGQGGMGTRDWSVITIGGQNSDGSDAVTDLTRLFLDVQDGYRLHFPDIKFRWCNRTKKDDLRRVVEIMRSGLGMPSIRNDEVAIPSMLDMYPGDVTLEEARNWAVVGCNTPGATTNSKGACRRDAWFPQFLKSVEYALFNGKDPETGFEWIKSVETGDSTRFADFEEFYQAWLKQWEWIASTEVRLRNKCFEKWAETCRRPFLSGLYKGCLETGDDIVQFDMPRFSFQGCAGWVDIIDSLAAVKYLVYDQKKYTMAQLTEACRADWEGYEEMRRDFKRAPKFGNDDDYVDLLMARATNDTYNVGRNLKDGRAKPVFVQALPVSFVYMFAPYIGAIPNGRKRGEPLADSGIAPHAEFDKSGPWERMNSALKIDQAKWKAYIYNQKFDYPSVAGDAGLEKMVDYVYAALMGGQSQLQFNCISQEVLRDAQEQPEKFPYLSVRVSGYTAFFTSLPKFMQDAVVERVDHKL